MVRFFFIILIVNSVICGAAEPGNPKDPDFRHCKKDVSACVKLKEKCDLGNGPACEGFAYLWATVYDDIITAKEYAGKACNLGQKASCEAMKKMADDQSRFDNFNKKQANFERNQDLERQKAELEVKIREQQLANEQSRASREDESDRANRYQNSAVILQNFLNSTNQLPPQPQQQFNANCRTTPFRNFDGSISYRTSCN